MSSSTLTLSLCGMSLLHRAGLGGLACSLKCIERLRRHEQLSDKDAPGAPWADGAPPWTINEQAIVINFGRPEHAGQFLRKLFLFAFGLRNEMIYLPGQYDEANGDPNLAVCAELQAGLVLTFLQHGRVRALAKETKTLAYDPEITGVSTMTVEFKPCSGYKHRDGWEDLVDTKGRLREDPIEVVGPLSPGAVVRHNAFPTETKIEDTPDRVLPLYFAMIGCLALPINRGSAALIVPEVVNLLEFISERPLMTPTTSKDCRITTASDAALQAQIRLRAKSFITRSQVPGCYAMTFAPTTWARQQKSRVATSHVPSGDEARLTQFDVAMTELPPRIAKKVIQDGKPKRGQSRKERTEYFWADSVIRPLIADNLASGREDRPWFAGFVRLMTALDVNGTPLRNKVSFERKGLYAMTTKIAWDKPAHGSIVQAVHEALRNRYGQIAYECKDRPVAMKNRFSGEYDRWRLAFAGAKTADQFRGALCDLFSRGGQNRVLRDTWANLVPILADSKQWQLARDLALVALASYAGKGEPETNEGE